MEEVANVAAAATAPTVEVEEAPPAIAVVSARYVVRAWYGSEGRPQCVNADVLRALIVRGRLVIDGDHEFLFGKAIRGTLEMHLRHGGYDFYPCARSGERFEFPSRAATPAVIVHAAWYGVEGGVHTQVNYGGEVARTLQRAVEACGGRLALDGDYSRLLGFDPAVGARKVLAMYITYKGTTYDVRAPEGVPFEHPDLPTGRVAAPAPPAPPAPPMQIVHAWYGVEGGVQECRDGGVVAALCRVLRDNGGRLVLDGDHNRLLGFDPVYGVVKVLAIHVRCNGKDVHLRAPEGQRFEFAPPPAVASSASAAASATNGTTAAGRKRAPPDVCFLSARDIALVCVVLLACHCGSLMMNSAFVWQQKDSSIVQQHSLIPHAMMPPQAPQHANCNEPPQQERGVTPPETHDAATRSDNKDVSAMRDGVRDVPNARESMLERRRRHFEKLQMEESERFERLRAERQEDEERALRYCERYHDVADQPECGGMIEVINAWYGIAWGNTVSVTERLRTNVAANGGRMLMLEGNLTKYFGVDPAPNKTKVAAIHVRYNGKEHHLRAAEMRTFHFPGKCSLAPKKEEVIPVPLVSVPKSSPHVTADDKTGPFITLVPPSRQPLQAPVTLTPSKPLRRPGDSVPLEATAVKENHTELVKRRQAQRDHDEAILTRNSQRYQDVADQPECGGMIEVINAWYGIAWGNTVSVTERLRANVAANGGRMLMLDGNLTKYFKVDPAPNKTKVAAIHVRYNGKEHHLRATEMRTFHFPGNCSHAPKKEEVPKSSCEPAHEALPYASANQEVLQHACITLVPPSRQPLQAPVTLTPSKPLRSAREGNFIFSDNPEFPVTHATVEKQGTLEPTALP